MHRASPNYTLSAEKSAFSFAIHAKQHAKKSSNHFHKRVKKNTTQKKKLQAYSVQVQMDNHARKYFLSYKHFGKATYELTQ